MVRAPSVDKNGLRKGAWSEEEDNKLTAYIQRYGHWNWRQLPKFAGLSRCGKSCRLRWMNYLKPGLKKGSYSKQEEELIEKLHEEFGNKWSAIAAKLPGRTDNEIKNYWHTHLKKHMKQDLQSTKSTEQASDISQHVYFEDQKEQASAISVISDSTRKKEISINVDAGASSEISSSRYNSTLLGGGDWMLEDCITSLESFAEPFGSFWTDSFFSDISYSQISPSTSCISTISSTGSMADPIGYFWTQPFLPDTSYSQISRSTSCSSPFTPQEPLVDPVLSFWTEPFSLDTSHN